MNDFCLYCTGGDKKEIQTCEFKNCPFWEYRFNNLPYQELRRDEQKQERD